MTRLRTTAKCAGIVLVMLMPACVFAEAVAAVPQFSRYEVILSRKPFGEPPQKPTPADLRTPAKPQHNFYDDLHLVAITERPNGTRVGFVNRKNRKDAFLYVGETTDDGITVVSADYDEGIAVVKKGEQEGEIRFRKGLSGPTPPPGRKGLSTRSGTSKKLPDFLKNRKSYLDRLRERRARMKAAQEKAAAARAAEANEAVLEETVEKTLAKTLEKRLQKYQAEVIRKGLPTLPIPLTEETDNQLVKEGFLPPRD